MERARSVFSLAEPKRLYVTGMFASAFVHLLIVAAVVVLPQIRPSQRVTEVKSYRVKMIAPDQLGKMPEPGGAMKAREALLRAAQRDATVAAKNTLPVYAVKKVGDVVEGKTPSRVEIKKLDTPSLADAKPKEPPGSLAQWEHLVPTVTEKTTSKPIEQRKELLHDAPSAKVDSRSSTQSKGQAEQTQKGGEEGAMTGGTATRQEAQKGTPAGGKESSGKAGEEAGSSSASAGETQEYSLARKLYYSEVWRAIQSQWAVPVEILTRDDLETIIVIKIRRDGTIMEMHFEKKSGNDVFDTSAWKAVQKANPLPPFPKTYSPPSEEIGIRFKPKDLLKRQGS